MYVVSCGDTGADAIATLTGASPQRKVPRTEFSVEFKQYERADQKVTKKAGRRSYSRGFPPHQRHENPEILLECHENGYIRSSSYDDLRTDDGSCRDRHSLLPGDELTEEDALAEHLEDCLHGQLLESTTREFTDLHFEEPLEDSVGEFMEETEGCDLLRHSDKKISQGHRQKHFERTQPRSYSDPKRYESRQDRSDSPRGNDGEEMTPQYSFVNEATELASVDSFCEEPSVYSDALFDTINSPGVNHNDCLDRLDEDRDSPFGFHTLESNPSFTAAEELDHAPVPCQDMGLSGRPCREDGERVRGSNEFIRFKKGSHSPGQSVAESSFHGEGFHARDGHHSMSRHRKVDTHPAHKGFCESRKRIRVKNSSGIDYTMHCESCS